jgi:sulfate-transporting ATPase
MTQVFQIALLGLGAGSLYAIAAIGLVLVYRGSGVVNFAQGAMGMVAAYIFFEVHQRAHLPEMIAVIAGLLASGVIGAAFHFLVLRRMTNASMLAKIVATLALLIVLQDAVTLLFGQVPQIVTSLLPTGEVRIFGASIGEDRLCIFGIVIVLTVVLWAIYKFTTFGVATSAVAENSRAAATLGVSPNLIGLLNWAIGAALGGIAAILLAPITSLSSENLSLIVIPVLAAAIVGRFSSFPITMVAGLAIGITQSEVTRYVSTPGWPTAIPFVFVAISLIRGRSIPNKDESSGRLPSLGTGRISWGTGLLIMGGGLLISWEVTPYDWLAALQLQIVIAILMLSYVVITGYAGQVSLVQLGLAGLGAVATGWFYNGHGWPFVFALLAGVTTMIPVCIVIGLAGVRTRGVDLAIVTLGLSEFLENVVLGNPSYVGRYLSNFSPSLNLFGLNINGFTYPSRYATLEIIFLGAVCLAVASLRRSRAGRRLIAVRTNERAAAALGISVVSAKLYAFVLGGMIAALGGSLLAFDPLISGSGGFSTMQSIVYMQGVVFGGVGHIGGPLIASSLQSGAVGQRALYFLGGDGSFYLQLGTGVALLAMLSSAPDGLAGLFVGPAQRWRAFVTSKVRRSGHRTAKRPEVAVLPRAVARRQSLSVRGLTVRFGGTVALDGLTLEVRPGEVVGLIGPNGSGKSTAIEAITGFVTPEAGTIRLGHKAIDRWSPERRARAGLSRTFQSLELFDDLTVLENIQAACDPHDLGAYATGLARPGRATLTQAASDALRDFGLDQQLDAQVRYLNYAQRRLLAVARAFASGGSILLLDEPAAGLSETETATLSAALRRLAVASNMGTLLIEHNVDMVLRTCDRVYALDRGMVIGEGDPAAISSNPAVVEAYLGTTRFRAEPAAAQGAAIAGSESLGSPPF